MEAPHGNSHFQKTLFSLHLLPFVFFSQSCACCVLKCLCALVWMFGCLDHSFKKITFSFLFSSPYLIFFPPLCFFPSLFPCLVALSSLALLLHSVTSSPHHVAIILLFHHLVVFRVVSLPCAFLLCVALLPCYFTTITFQVPLDTPHLLLCYLVASHLVALCLTTLYPMLVGTSLLLPL